MPPFRSKGRTPTRGCSALLQAESPPTCSVGRKVKQRLNPQNAQKYSFFSELFVSRCVNTSAMFMSSLTIFAVLPGAGRSSNKTSKSSEVSQAKAQPSSFSLKPCSTTLHPRSEAPFPKPESPAAESAQSLGFPVACVVRHPTGMTRRTT